MECICEVESDNIESVLIESIKFHKKLIPCFPIEKLTKEMVSEALVYGWLNNIPEEFLTSDMYTIAAKNYRVISKHRRTLDNDVFDINCCWSVDYKNMEKIKFENVETVKAWLENNKDIEILKSRGQKKEAGYIATMKKNVLPEKYHCYIQEFVPKNLRVYYESNTRREDFFEILTYDCPFFKECGIKYSTDPELSFALPVCSIPFLKTFKL